MVKQMNKTKLKRILRRVLREGTHEKLNSDVTGNSANLDQEMYFDLAREIDNLCEKYSSDERFAPYGVTPADVLEELKNVIREIE